MGNWKGHALHGAAAAAVAYLLAIGQGKLYGSGLFDLDRILKLEIAGLWAIAYIALAFIRAWFAAVRTKPLAPPSAGPKI